MSLVLTAALIVGPSAHSPAAYEQWLDGWERWEQTQGVTHDHLADLWSFLDRHSSGPSRARPAAPVDVAVWRGLIGEWFQPGHVDKALAVVWCESRGDPTAVNPSSGAAGLFQHLPKYWPARSAAAGVEGVDIFDPVANTAVAAWLVYEGGGWSHWPRCGR